MSTFGTNRSFSSALACLSILGSGTLRLPASYGAPRTAFSPDRVVSGGRRGQNSTSHRIVRWDNAQSKTEGFAGPHVRDGYKKGYKISAVAPVL
jgi:hypothetical protein